MKKRVAIFFIRNADKEIFSEWQRDVIKSLLQYFDRFIVVSNQYSDELCTYISTNEVFNTINNLKSEFEYLYLINDTISAPIFPLNTVFDFLEDIQGISSLCTSSELFGEANANMSFYGKITPLLFMKIPFDLPQFNKIISKSKLSKSFKFLCDIQDKYSKHTYFEKICTEEKNLISGTITPIAFDMRDYICDWKFPFLYLYVFNLKRIKLIEYGTDSKMNQLMIYLLKCKDFNISGLYDYILSECDCAIIKNLLNLNFSFPSCEYQENPLNIKKSTAIFAHLYYKNTVEKYLEYLDNIPENIPIYISVSCPETQTFIEQKLSTKLKKHTTVVLVKSRGRDVAALLVGLKLIALSYDRFLFIHDKGAHSEEAFSVGNAFSDCLWDNLIGSKQLVENVMSFMDENSKIGILSAPPPYFGVYGNLKGNFWTICYDKTVALAKRLNIDCRINNYVNPITLGMAFWCQTDALKPLLEYNWKYEDFEDEPMGLDGTISHSIERILPYVAQTQGYLTGWAFNKDFEKNCLESHQYMLERVLNIIMHKNVLNAYNSSSIYNLNDEEKCFNVWSFSSIGIKCKLLILIQTFKEFAKGIVYYVKAKVKAFNTRGK